MLPYEILIASTLVAAALYAVAGLVASVFLHRDGLASLDPDVGGSSLLFRVLITPGLVMLWPLLLVRWHRATHHSQIEEGQAPTDSMNQRRFRLWHRAMVTLLALLAPAALTLTLLTRVPPPEGDSLPFSLPSANTSIVRPGPGYAIGQMFPSVPAIFRPGRDINKRTGLIVDALDGSTIALTSIYWATSMDDPNTVPAEAVLLGTVWGADNHWLRYPESGMTGDGYWIAYSFATQGIEVYATSRSRREGQR